MHIIYIYLRKQSLLPTALLLIAHYLRLLFTPPSLHHPQFPSSNFSITHFTNFIHCPQCLPVINCSHLHAFNHRWFIVWTPGTWWNIQPKVWQSDVYHLQKTRKLIHIHFISKIRHLRSIDDISRSEVFHFNDSLDSLRQMRFNPQKVRLNLHGVRLNWT